MRACFHGAREVSQDVLAAHPQDVRWLDVSVDYSTTVDVDQTAGNLCDDGARVLHSRAALHLPHALVAQVHDEAHGVCLTTEHRVAEHADDVRVGAPWNAPLMLS